MISGLSPGPAAAAKMISGAGDRGEADLIRRLFEGQAALPIIEGHARR